MAARGRPLALAFGPQVAVFETELRPGDRFLGLRFWPHAGAATLGLSAEELVGRNVPLAELGPEWAARAERLESIALGEGEAVAGELMRLLAEMVGDPPPDLDEAAGTAVARLVESGGRASGEELAAEAGLSERQLQRRFRRATGLSPKRFARIRRFREAAASLLGEAPPEWAAVADAAGYADQAHLCREFRQLVGLSPERLRRLQAEYLHENVRP